MEQRSAVDRWLTRLGRGLVLLPLFLLTMCPGYRASVQHFRGCGDRTGSCYRIIEITQVRLRSPFEPGHSFEEVVGVGYRFTRDGRSFPGLVCITPINACRT